MFREADDAERALELPSRRKVYRAVCAHAGSHMREVERLCGMPHGVAKYHLDYLSRRGVIRQQKDGSNVRYFPSGLTQEEKRILGLLRSPTSRKILIRLFEKRRAGNKELAAFLKVSPPTVSWHMRRLAESGAVIKAGDKYSLALRREAVLKLLVAYRRSFFDSLVDRTVETWG